MRFHISNMNCDGCAKGVAASIQQADPRARAEFDLERREVTIGDASAPAERIAKAMRDAGWKAEPLPA